MEQTVYVDLFFLINFSMDFLSFVLTSRLLSHKLSLWRAVAGAAVGGVYACVSLFLPVGGVWAVLTHLAVCFVMCAVAVLRRGELRGSFGYGVVYAACSIVLGGFMTALFSVFNRLGVDKLFGSDAEGDGLSVWLFALLAAISGVVSMLGIRFFRKRSARCGGRVELTLGRKSVSLNAFCDSGNLLVDPISGKPCILVERGAVETLLPVGIIGVIDRGDYSKLNQRDARRISVIPAHTATGGGLIYAVRMDNVRINMGKGWHSTDASVALCSLDGADGAQALIPSELVIGVP